MIVDNVIFREELPTNLLERRFSFSQYAQSRIGGICRSIINLFAIIRIFTVVIVDDGYYRFHVIMISAIILATIRLVDLLAPPNPSPPRYIPRSVDSWSRSSSASPSSPSGSALASTAAMRSTLLETLRQGYLLVNEIISLLLMLMAIY